jgi:hypothetical protein
LVLKAYNLKFLNFKIKTESKNQTFKKMKNPILIFALGSMIYLSSCENGSRQRGIDTTYSDSLEINRDDAVNERNNTGTPGIQDNQTRDTLGTQGTVGAQGQISQGWTNVPQRIRDEVERDNSLKNRNLVQSRAYTQDGRTYYELTFDGDEEQKIVFDELGNRVNNDN